LLEETGFWVCCREYSSREYVSAMHEMRIAADLAGIVAEAAGREQLVSVSLVRLQFGELIQIVPELFRFAFREITRGTIAERAIVEIEIIPVSVRCASCQTLTEIPDLRFICGYCGGNDLEIIHGKELFIKSIEGEQQWKSGL
jgi:hydrogenase nickel incorporation protein HypA/HybF